MEPSNPISSWRVIGKSVTGAAHVRHGQPCQDAIEWQVADDFAVLVIADGHGSERSPYSDKGARFAVKITLEVLFDLYRNAQGTPPEPWRALKHEAEERLPQVLVRRWVERVKLEDANSGTDNIPSEEEWRKRRLVLYGSTLLATLLTPRFLLFLQLGDGDIVAVGNDRSCRCPLPKDERLIANETTSLSMPDAWREMQVAFWPMGEEPPALVMLSTDGYANSFVSRQDFLQAAVDYWELIQEHGPEQVDSHLEEWLREASERGSGDDITVGLAFCFPTPKQHDERLCH
jgi:serine/threonine protein phosphatase PrpC